MAKFEDRLREFVDAMERLQFREPPEIIITVGGDARLGGFDADLKCEAPSVRTPWGSADQFGLIGRLTERPGTNEAFHADLILRLGQLRTEWVESSEATIHTRWNVAATNTPAGTVSWEAVVSDLKSRWGGSKRLNVAGDSTRVAAGGDEIHTRLAGAVDELESKWLQGSSVGVTASLTTSITNRSISQASWNAAIAQPRTPWGTAEQAHVKSSIARRESNQVDAGMIVKEDWSAIEPFDVDLECESEGVKMPNLAVDRLRFSTGWRSPVLRINNLTAQLYGGNVGLSGTIDTRTRRVEAAGKFDLDPRELAPLLDATNRNWVNDLTWTSAPKVGFQVSATLPAWTNTPPDWIREVQPSVVVAADINAGGGAYRGIAYDSAEILVTLSNLVFELPRVVVHRPEGPSELSYATDLKTRDFHLHLASRLDPKLALPLLENADVKEALNLFQFGGPPNLQADLWGRRGTPDLLGAQARLAMTNFAFRGESFSNIITSVSYTNKLIRFTDISIERDQQQKITAPLATLDLVTQRLWFTNGHSTLDPMLVRIIGPETVAAIKPYHFHTPPTIDLYGSLALQDITTTDLHYQIVEGGPFDWLNFNLPKVVGNVLWITNQLIITNVDASFYGGRIQGDAVFTWGAHGDDADYHFHLDVADANLNHLISDLSSPTNKLEGILNGTLTVTTANTGDIRSWNGYGTAFLKDGLLWNFPLYGLFSPVLNAVAPGLGNSRAKEGSATYIITNSVIRTDDLEIRSPPVRLHYDGTVDFDKVVKAKVVAEPLVGPFSRLIKPFAIIFEYKVTGTLDNPKSEPLFIPKLFLFPLHPIQTIKNLLQTPEEPPKPAAATPEKKP
jgi:hypothetical protein